jgi:hypothetical protein
MTYIYIYIQFTSFTHSVTSVGKTDRPTVTLSRAFHCLRNIYATFYKRHFLYTTGTTNNFINTEATHFPLRESNFFYHPQFISPCRHHADAQLSKDKLDQEV